jgi:hypothetical protein
MKRSSIPSVRTRWSSRYEARRLVPTPTCAARLLPGLPGLHFRRPLRFPIHDGILW